MTERKGIIEKHYLSFYRYLCFIWLIINWFLCDRLDRPWRKPLMYRKALSINTKKHRASCKNTFGIVGIVKHLDFWLEKNWVISTHVRKNLNLFSVNDFGKRLDPMKGELSSYRETLVNERSFHSGHFAIIDIIGEMNSIACLEIILPRNWSFKTLARFPPCGLAVLGAKYFAPTGILMTMAAKFILTENSCS